MPDSAHRRLRAPTEDGAALIDPPLKAASELVKQNLALSADWRYECQGRRLESMVFSARAELCTKARGFTRRYQSVGFVPELTPSTPFILSGHQPELFHSGVWFKNFLLSALGRQSRAVAVNFIVDSDLVRKTAIAVPAKSESQSTIESVAYDSSGDMVPYEERTVRDEWLLQSFAERVRTAYETCHVDGNEPYQLLMDDLWKDVIRAAQIPTHPRLGLVLAQARHLLESRLGLTTLEIPLSQIAQTVEFRWFVVDLLCQLPRFWRIYNSSLLEYRNVNHIRSNTHPVPSLQEHDDWLESPFFVWTREDVRRRHLFVQQKRASLVLSDRQGLRLVLKMAADGSPHDLIEQLAEAESRGIKIRPRALITTMYARLLLSDLFIHGIGGAKYDELTDLIIRRFFGIEPPAYVTATATFRLPIERPEVTPADVERSATRLRELRYRPESILREPLVMLDARLKQQLEAFAAEKRDFLAQHDLRRCDSRVFQQLDQLNRAMHSLLRPVEEESRSQHGRLVEQAKQSRVLGSREFSFVLFPSEILPARLLDLCKVLS